MKSFNYLGHKFIPIGTLPKADDFFATTRKCRRIGKGISNYEGGRYSHAEFYKRAAKVGGAEFDVFKMDGAKTVLPCENELFEYRGEIK